MNLAKSCWLTFPCWRHDFISVVWKRAPTRQVISMSQMEYHSANVLPNISLSVQCYYFQVYLRTITFLSFLLSSCTSKKSVYFALFFPVTLYAANIKPKKSASWNSKVGKLPEIYSQTDAKTHAETGSRPSSLVVSTICSIPDRQTEWSTGDPSSVIILL